MCQIHFRKYFGVMVFVVTTCFFLSVQATNWWPLRHEFNCCKGICHCVRPVGRPVSSKHFVVFCYLLHKIFFSATSDWILSENLLSRNAVHFFKTLSLFGSNYLFPALSRRTSLLENCQHTFSCQAKKRSLYCKCKKFFLLRKMSNGQLISNNTGRYTGIRYKNSSRPTM